MACHFPKKGETQHNPELSTPNIEEAKPSNTNTNFRYIYI